MDSSLRLLRKLQPADLTAILKGHEEWLNSKYSAGHRADLRNSDLRQIDLSRVQLQQAVLIGANLGRSKLQHARLYQADLSSASLTEASLFNVDLRQANLGGADLSDTYLFNVDLGQANLAGVNFRNAKLYYTKLNEATLQNSDLSSVKGLSAEELAGANVAGAILPKDIHKFETLKPVEEICKRAGKLFISMLLGCVYCWLTLVSTVDAHLLTNTATLPLPIIQTEVPIVWFYLAVPILLLSIYIWFHLYLQDLWKNLAELPAIFPDGKVLDEKVYPWILTSLVRPHFSRLREGRPHLSRLKVGVSILLAWWVVPFTLALFWGRYLPRHDWAGTSLQMVLLLLAVVCAIRFQHLAKLTLRGDSRAPIQFSRKRWRISGPYYDLMMRTWKLLTTAIAVLLLLCVISDGAIKGRKSDQIIGLPKCWQFGDQLSSHRDIVPAILPCLGFRAFALLSRQDVSSKSPSQYNEEVNPKVGIGANLKYANLEYAHADQSFLSGADLYSANLIKAELKNANLKHANLSKAILQSARLDGAKMQEAILYKADLKKAFLNGVNLQNAFMLGADLRDAEIAGAKFQDAILIHANLVNAKMGVFGDKVALPASSRVAALYYFPDSQESPFVVEHNGADFTRADLTNADLRNANFEGSDFTEAVLNKTHLEEAILTNVIGLTQKQLNNSCVSQSTMLPRNLKHPSPCEESSEDSER